MSAVKRAKWIEGITQSKRVLRDLADIVTSAIRNENGVVAEENWKLVYPRPFAEENIVRGRLIQDETNTRRYIPVADRSELIMLTGTTPVALQNLDAVASTVVVQSEDLAATFVKDVDYTFDEVNKTLARIEGGNIIDGEKVQVFYGVTFHQILDTIPVTVEKKLVIADPDREIVPSIDPYTIDYAGKKIEFTNDPPTDAEYFALTFTEVTDTFGRQERTMLRLEKDGLDPNGRTFRLPAGYGEIAEDLDTREVAGTITGGTLGANGSGTIQYILDEVNHTIEFTTGAPTILPNQTMYINVAEYTNPPTNTITRRIRVALAKDTSDGTGQTFKMVGTFNELNEGEFHNIEIDTDATAPVLFKHLSSLHAGYEVVEGDELIVSYDSPLVTTRQDIEEDLVVTLTTRGVEDLKVGLDKIKDRVVLQTTTTPEQIFEPVIGDDFGARDTATELTMYVEFTKPDRLVNPETGLERYTDFKGRQQQTQYNNHYIMARMFDQWDDEFQKPADAVYDGETLVDKGAYVSDWSKYAWFKDWKEYMVDELDEDAGLSNAGDGVVFQEVITQGMTEEFPIQFWVSSNNNRLSVVLMGDPTLDQDNFLTSFAYFGRIHPFFDSECIVKRDDTGAIVMDTDGNPILEEKRTYFENDVAGNFAMTVGSSTMPAAIGTPPKGEALIEAVQLNVDNTTTPATPIVGELYDRTVFGYVVTYLTEIGESKPTPIDAGRIVVPQGTVSAGSTAPTQGISLKIRFRLPDEATGYRIYRYHQANTATFNADANRHENYKLVTSVEKLDRLRTIEYIDEGNILPMYSTSYDPVADATTITLINDTLNGFYSKFLAAVATARSFESVVRDRFTGAILDVKFSDKFGKDTATGVNDIVMFQTRSGLKYQRHQAAFITTEEFMRKEKSGQSRWTGKFHLSPIYIEHSYDKQRGWLDGVMAVDDSGIEHLDELIVDKDTPTEEVYKFFRVNAPFSMFNNSPNYAYGIAIIKSSMKWE